ncbi:MAG: hypothetical protein J7L42_02965, partial [Elusimicrobia bacterium]|nr:hypothetical protein [Elusimicrobiota bacterium]
NKVTRKKVDRGQWIEDSPPTLKLRRIYVAADPWSAKKRKEDRGKRIDKMSFLRKQESRKRKSEVGSRRSENPPLYSPLFKRGENRGDYKVRKKQEEKWMM